jgi:hypothetical protein
MWHDTGGALLGNDRPPPAVGRGHSERLGVFGKLAALPSASQRQDEHPPPRDATERAGSGLRGLGIGATLTLCLPVLLMVLPLVGFLLLPLLPLIGLSWSLSLGDRPSAPTDRPRAPATCASALPPRLAQAA